LVQAQGDKQNVMLSVLRSNPAKLLYERLGFIAIAESDIDYTMSYKHTIKK